MSRVIVDGRTAVISGAGSGIGRALAVRLSVHGCPVALTDWDEGGFGGYRRRSVRSGADPGAGRA